MKPITFQKIGAEATRFTTSSTTYVDVPGLDYSFVNSTGSAVRILLITQLMLTPTPTIAAYARITVNGTAVPKSEHYGSPGDIPTIDRTILIDVAAGGSANIKVQIKSGGAATVGIVNELQDHSSGYTGIVFSNA